MYVEIDSFDDLVAIVREAKNRNDEFGVVVEDEEGEVRPVEYAWIDHERKMLRLGLRRTKFEDKL